MAPSSPVALSAAASGEPAPTGETLPRRRPLRRLRDKLFLFTFPVVAGIVVVAALVAGRISYEHQRHEIEGRAAALANVLAQALARPVWNLDEPAYREQLRALQNDPAFLQARLEDDRGELLFELRTAVDRDEGLDATADIRDPAGQRVIGRLEITLSLDPLQRQVRRLAFLGGGSLLALLLSFMLVLQVSMRALVTRPLDRLLDAMKAVERKRWTTVDWRSDDELGQVCARFDQMVAALKSGDEARHLLEALRKTQDELLRTNRALSDANARQQEGLRYARLIQQGHLPDHQVLSGLATDVAVLWEPLQTVGGDYYWIERLDDDRAVIFLADCTGHGVPGAFVALSVAAALERILRAEGVSDPAEVLLRLDRAVRRRLRQQPGDEGPADDGLEAACCLYDRRSGHLRYAGAGLPLLSVRGGVATEHRADRAWLGYRSLPAPERLTTREIAVAGNETFFLFTDGMIHQMGGWTGGGRPPRLFGRQRLSDFLARQGETPLEDQLARLRRILADWRGDQAVRDDMAVLAFRLSADRMTGSPMKGSPMKGSPMKGRS